MFSLGADSLFSVQFRDSSKYVQQRNKVGSLTHYKAGVSVSQSLLVYSGFSSTSGL